MRNPLKDVDKISRNNPVYILRENQIQYRECTGAGLCYKIDGTHFQISI